MILHFFYCQNCIVINKKEKCTFFKHSLCNIKTLHIMFHPHHLTISHLINIIQDSSTRQISFRLTNFIFTGIHIKDDIIGKRTLYSIVYLFSSET